MTGDGTVIRWVFFDVGETLVDETREWARWADWLGVPRHTFSAVFGAVIARGEHWTHAFQILRPGLDLAAEERRRTEAGVPPGMTEADLYPDARRCLERLAGLDVRIGIAGNQPARAERLLTELALPVDLLATSEGWGVAKPSVAFFERVVREAGVPAESVLYVGDRADNDVLPARRAGLRTAMIRRGPWAYLVPGNARADFRLDGLDELPELVARRNGRTEVE